MLNRLPAPQWQRCAADHGLVQMGFAPIQRWYQAPVTGSLEHCDIAARPLRLPDEMPRNRIWLAAWRWQCARRLLHLAPRAGRGRFASGALATRSKSGEGACPQAQTRGYAPSPGFFRCAWNPTSPRTRGEVAQAALPRTSRYQLKCDSPADELGWAGPREPRHVL